MATWGGSDVAILMAGDYKPMRAWEIDPSALVIRLLERAGLAWDVTRVSRERQSGRYAGPAG